MKSHDAANFEVSASFRRMEQLIRNHAPRLMRQGGYISMTERVNSGYTSKEYAAKMKGRNDHVKELKKTGLTVKQIAETTNMHANTIYKILKTK